jgi:DNA (cytosine-5)-methyltransferase 1
MENVRGILYPFKGERNATGEKTKTPAYAEIIKTALETELDYKVWYDVVQSKDFGVPQTRPRFILMGIRKDLLPDDWKGDPFKTLREMRGNFLRHRGLGTDPISTREALRDLCRAQTRLHVCDESPRFKQGAYGTSRSPYQTLMHGGMNGAIADSHRFANHRPDTLEKFEWLLQNCPKGKILRPEERGVYANSKHTVYILDPDQPAPTVTTLPDDILHFSEPRILTVRELARLQSFPDWFEFKGKYTTGSKERVKECPRYTQVGNAVPPLLAEALGEAFLAFLDKFRPLHPWK